jgi:hypothetical protein
MSLINQTEPTKFQYSFQNPTYDENFSIERSISIRQNDFIANLDETRHDENLDIDEIDANQKRNLITINRSNSTFLQDIDIECCNKIITFKPKTYNNIKNTIQILKPFLVLFIMIVILIGIFRIDFFLPSNDLADSNEET